MPYARRNPHGLSARDDEMFDGAGILIRRGMPEREAERIVREINRRYLKPFHPHAVLRRTLEVGEYYIAVDLEGFHFKLSPHLREREYHLFTPEAWDTLRNSVVKLS